MSSNVQKDGKENDGAGEKKMDLLALCPRVGHLTDRFGNGFYVGNAGHFWLPPFPIGPDNDYRSHLSNITNMDIRDDDILVCSYPKAGLHWTLELMHMLRNKSTEYSKDGLFFNYSLDANPHPPTGEKDPGKPRILVTHLPFSFIPKQAVEKKIKILYLNRNPKDVMVAFYSFMSNHGPPFHFPGTFEHFVRLILECGYYYTTWFDHTMSFQRGFEEHAEVPTMISIFEDMKRDPVGGVKKLNEFIGTGCSEELCKGISEACNIKKLKPFKEANRTDMEKAMFKEGSSSFFRKGDIGDWKNWFTPELNKDFDEACKRYLADCKIKFQYE